jgi:hypothetical protein
MTTKNKTVPTPADDDRSAIERDAREQYGEDWRAALAFPASPTNSELHAIFAAAVELESRLRAMLRSPKHRSVLRAVYGRRGGTSYEGIITDLTRMDLNLESAADSISSILIDKPAAA